MIASLPMYDWPELTAAHDKWWQKLGGKLRTAGIDAPQFLTRDGNDECHWLEPELLLGQTCGYPFSTILQGKVQYLATPVYDVEGCSGPYYSSAIIVRRDSSLTMEMLGHGCFAFNGEMSLSGYRCVKAMAGEPRTFFSSLRESGGHRASAGMVANGGADVAALDAVCWHLLQEHEPAIADKLKVLGWTAQYPALPLITSLETNPGAVEKIRKVLSQITPPVALAIKEFEILAAAEYDKLSML